MLTRHGCKGALHALFYTAMRLTRSGALIGGGISLFIAGCGAADPAVAGAPPTASNQPSIDVVQVETVTTVQSWAGSFLSPTPERAVPAYVERGAAVSSAEYAQLVERAKVDIALLFRASPAGSANQDLSAQLISPSAAPWSGVAHCFPHVEQSATSVSWPLGLSAVAPSDLDSAVSPEWRGWQDFRGLSVRASTRQAGSSAPVATLDFTTSGLSSPLMLSADGETLLLTNRSDHAVARALLIYSHPGGVAVTAVNALGPGERALTILGPKEHPPQVLLDLARQQLSDFFAQSVGSELAPAMAAAKSIPFLETQGLRLVALLSEELEPAALSFSAPVAAQQRVVLSHSEILKPEEEARVLDVVMDPSVGAEQALATLGRFTEAKLEFAAQSSNIAVSAKATALLDEVRRR